MFPGYGFSALGGGRGAAHGTAASRDNSQGMYDSDSADEDDGGRPLSPATFRVTWEVVRERWHE